MAAGHANAPLRRELLAGLIGRIHKESHYARRLKLLVASCLETLLTIPAELRDEVESCVNDLVPPGTEHPPAPWQHRRISPGASACDSRRPIRSSRRAVVRTAYLINGPRAIDLLVGYGADSRPSIHHELVNVGHTSTLRIMLACIGGYPIRR